MTGNMLESRLNLEQLKNYNVPSVSDRSGNPKSNIRHIKVTFTSFLKALNLKTQQFNATETVSVNNVLLCLSVLN